MAVATDIVTGRGISGAFSGGVCGGRASGIGGDSSGAL
jgi:hypothetical protein